MLFKRLMIAVALIGLLGVKVMITACTIGSCDEVEWQNASVDLGLSFPNDLDCVYGTTYLSNGWLEDLITEEHFSVVIEVVTETSCSREYTFKSDDTEGAANNLDCINTLHYFGIKVPKDLSYKLRLWLIARCNVLPSDCDIYTPSAGNPGVPIWYSSTDFFPPNTPPFGLWIPRPAYQQNSQDFCGHLDHTYSCN